ncbi:hypothetical protein OKN36_14900 [Furfurilactobacillus sp. OKN36]
MKIMKNYLQLAGKCFLAMTVCTAFFYCLWGSLYLDNKLFEDGFISYNWFTYATFTFESLSLLGLWLQAKAFLEDVIESWPARR